MQFLNEIIKTYHSLLVILSKSSVQSKLLWVVGASYADSFIRNGWRKFDSEGFWSKAFLDTWGYPLWFMYFIGALEFVSGICMLIPRLRPYASFVLAIVMVGALVTKVIFGIINGVDADSFYGVIRNLDIFFLLSSIAIFLFFMTYKKSIT